MEKEVHHHHHHHHRLCDYCDSSVALIYCKADSAKLCLSCDKQVHVTNQLFSKHFRSLLCDSCDDSPSSVFCETESSVLCQNCDWQHHSASSSVHSRRRPFEGFTGCPSVSELLTLLGLDDINDNKTQFVPDDSGSKEMLLWETPEMLSLNDLIGSGGSDHNYRAMDVPPLPKNRHATCGKHKEEMIRQLRELARSEPSSLKYETVDAGFELLAAENDQDLFGSACEVSGGGLKWLEEEQQDFPYCSSDDVNLRDSCSREEESLSVMVPVCNISSTSLSTRPFHEMNSVERNSALSRYKEKKKSRRYEKHIRYESRKIRAETRTRIKGRFAKAAADP